MKQVFTTICAMLSVAQTQKADNFFQTDMGLFLLATKTYYDHM
jgi:hypothetical protein